MDMTGVGVSAYAIKLCGIGNTGSERWGAASTKRDEDIDIELAE